MGSTTHNIAICRALQELTQDRLDAEVAERTANAQPTATNAPAPATNAGTNNATPQVKLTPTPANGWPVCHSEHPLWFLVNGKQEQIIKALSMSDYCVVIHVTNEISHDRNRSPVVANRVREAILRLFPGDTVKVLNVMPLTKPKRHEDPPFAFIAYNLRPTTHQALITQ
jgi:hypothetical protein